MNRQELIQLLDKYLRGDIAPEEETMLLNWYNSHQEQVQWDEPALGSREETEAAIWKRLQAALPAQAADKPTTRYRHLGLVAAASVFAALVLGFWWQRPMEKPLPQAVQTPSIAKPIQGKTTTDAILTLADGTTIAIGSAANGILARQGSTIVRKQGLKIIYELHQDTHGEMRSTAYNRVATPRGKQLQLVLPDGSHAWINAASSLRFPTAFAARQRRVELNGEAYFEVKQIPNTAFQVYVAPAASNGKQALVEVLGTHFNVSAYEEQRTIRTTLLEGSVKVLADTARPVLAKKLVAGQQAELGRAADGIAVRKVDAAREVAWQQGLFDFEGAGTREVMQELARWYDVDVAYRGNGSEKRFSGRFSRSMALADVLQMLELSGIRFDVRGRKITVLT